VQLENLTTKILGRKIIYYKQIDSTQLETWRKVKKNEIENGTIIIADIQTKAKGTHGRKWYTTENNNIALTILLKTNCEIEKLDGLTLEIAMIFVEVFKKLYNISLEIKNPNDLVYKNKKLGGILTQTKLKGKIVQYIAIGVRD